jgi:hypothetical protein
MDKTLKVALHPTDQRTRLLMTQGGETVLKGLLGPPRPMHPLSAKILLTGLSLWFQRPLSVVLYGDDPEFIFSYPLCDDLGFGETTQHYQVELVTPSANHPVRLPVAGGGDFRDLRKLCTGGGR